MPKGAARWSVVDLFSGAGGASAGFAAHPDFAVVAAADAQLGKPSSRPGSLGCNDTYEVNLGLRPHELDLGAIAGAELRAALALAAEPTVLVACPPCTGFSRTNATNHLHDDPRNSLIGRVFDFVTALRPSVLVMENAREMLMGRFAHHFDGLRARLTEAGYDVRAEIHILTRFGLPQVRERAVVIAARRPLTVRTLGALWDGYAIDDKATHVRRAIWGLPEVAPGSADPDDPMHVAPRFRDPLSLRRLRAVPHDGGSWKDLIGSTRTERLMTPGMKRLAAMGKLGSFPDVYGRLAWDRPAATVKRECGHVGNGRYAHPEQDRLCTVRELGIVQGFPTDYTFIGPITNRYRHLGDAVPPLIARQLASVCEWILTGRQPDLDSTLLAKTHLTGTDIARS